MLRGYSSDPLRATYRINQATFVAEQVLDCEIEIFGEVAVREAGRYARESIVKLHQVQAYTGREAEASTFHLESGGSIASEAEDSVFYVQNPPDKKKFTTLKKMGFFKKGRNHIFVPDGEDWKEVRSAKDCPERADCTPSYTIDELLITSGKRKIVKVAKNDVKLRRKARRELRKQRQS